MHPSPAEYRGPLRAAILVLDDDPLVTRMVTRLLAPSYAITSYNDPHDALSMICRGVSYDVILCDARMPQLSGLQFFEAVRRERPELVRCFIFMKGADSTAPGFEYLQHVERTRRLSKPFKIESLRAAITQVLASAGPAAS
jgi:CheY-like chemotaxis protein